MPAAIRLSEAVDQYLAMVKVTMAPTSLKVRKSTLFRFLSVTGNIYPKNLTSRHIDDFLVAHSHWEPSTRKTNLNYLGAFQQWLHARKLLDRGVDILEGKRRFRIPKKNRTHIDSKEFQRFLDSIDTPRDRIVVALGLFALLREGEIRAIQWRDVDLEAGFLHIWREKTGEYDDIPIPLELHEELVRWKGDVCKLMTQQLQNGANLTDLGLLDATIVGGEVIEPAPDWYVPCAMRANAQVVNGRNVFDASLTVLDPTRPLSNLGNRIKDILTEYGLDAQGVRMHTLRRSGASALLESLERGVYDESAMRVVQAMLGHKNLATTELYLNKQADRARRDFLIRGKALYSGAKDTGRVSGAEESAGV